MPTTGSNIPPSWRLPLAGLLAWMVPGAGHLLIGERTRGIIFLTVIGVTFWAGVAIGGVKNTVSTHRTLWLVGQMCAGVHPVAALAIGRQVQVPAGAPESDYVAFGNAEDAAVVYTAIAGMLNLLVIFDVLARAEQLDLEPVPAGPGRGRAP